ncbi:MAG: YhfC family glutamic-type intramembrane protease [Anaerolineales bacterium]|nr:YhfC family glutamic-type intramembrane protease [Anaerolineales bacterium]
MDILLIAHLLNGLLMIAIPIGLAIYLTRKFKLDWRLFWIGAATFVLSQVGHIPFNWAATVLLNRTPLANWPQGEQLVFNAIFLGLSAGCWEEFFRYGMYRWWVKDARSWGKGLLAGAGHGGIEAIILGALALYGFVQLVILRNADAAQLSQVVGADKVALAQAQITAYWSAPWHMAILGAVERLFAISFHLALSLLVLQALTRRQGWWVWLAVVLHALVNGLAVYLLGIGLSAYAIEGVIGLAAILAVAIIFALRQPEPQADPSTGSGLGLAPDSPIPVPNFTSQPVAETPENLDKTRYQ